MNKPGQSKMKNTDEQPRKIKNEEQTRKIKYKNSNQQKTNYHSRFKPRKTQP